jgi:hypothetical protein
MDKPPPKFGFPLFIALGFLVGAGVATALTFALAVGGPRFSYTTLVKLLFPFGSLGAYLGQVIGSAKHEKTGFTLWGTIPPGAIMVGAVIVVFGSFGVLFGVAGIMTLIYGTPQPNPITTALFRNGLLALEGRCPLANLQSGKEGPKSRFAGGAAPNETENLGPKHLASRNSAAPQIVAEPV